MDDARGRTGRGTPGARLSDITDDLELVVEIRCTASTRRYPRHSVWLEELVVVQIVRAHGPSTSFELMDMVLHLDGITSPSNDEYLNSWLIQGPARDLHSRGT